MQTSQLFIELGFKKNTTDSFLLDLGNCQLEAMEILAFPYGHCYKFLGYISDLRTASIIQFSLPYTIESRNQGIALLAYYLQHYKFKIEPTWLSEGLNYKSFLPWYVEEIVALEKVIVDDQYFKLLVKAANQFAHNSITSESKIYFDGELLTIEIFGHKHFCNGKGQRWKAHYQFDSEAFSRIPKRLPKAPLLISVRSNNTLQIHHSIIGVCNEITVQ